MADTTIGISSSLDERIKKLAEKRAQRMGLSKPLPKRTFLEILITEEEHRVETEK